MNKKTKGSTWIRPALGRIGAPVRLTRDLQPMFDAKETKERGERETERDKLK